MDFLIFAPPKILDTSFLERNLVSLPPPPCRICDNCRREMPHHEDFKIPEILALQGSPNLSSINLSQSSIGTFQPQRHSPKPTPDSPLHDVFAHPIDGGMSLYHHPGHLKMFLYH